jgi:integrase
VPFCSVFGDGGARAGSANTPDFTGLFWSERRDLNPGPPVPQTGALTGLRYAPTGKVSIATIGVSRNKLDKPGVSSLVRQPTSTDRGPHQSPQLRPATLANRSLISDTGARAPRLVRGRGMATGKITKTVVDGLAPRSMLWDTALVGFGVRRQTRDAFYLVRYRVAGRQRFLTIGRHGPFTVDEARREARRLLGVVAGGVDPATAKAEANRRLAETFGSEVERYLAWKRQGMKPRAHEEITRHLVRHGKPLSELPLAEIDRRTIAKRLGEIETASGPVARNRVRSSLSAFFAWAIREGLVETNPVSGTGKASETSRDRVLSERELTAVWAALDFSQFGEIVRLLILTGQRREEIGSLRWSEIDRDRIVLPPGRTKNRREHIIPLSPAAREILDRQPRRDERDLIFGIGAGGFSGWSDCKAGLDARVSIAPFRLHDLRRTAATLMADRLGVLPHVIEAVLNHVSGHKGGVAGIYNRARYEAEARDALERWAEFVGKITSA